MVEFIVPDDRERYRRPTHVAELRIGELLTIPLVEGVLTLSPYPLSYFFHLAGRHYLLDLPRFGAFDGNLVIRLHAIGNASSMQADSH